MRTQITRVVCHIHIFNFDKVENIYVWHYIIFLHF